MGNTSVLVPFVLCFGIELLCCLNLMYVFYMFYLIRVTEWLPIVKKDAHSAYDMFLSIIEIKLISLKSSESFSKKGDGPFRCFGYLSLFSDPINIVFGNIEPKRISVNCKF